MYNETYTGEKQVLRFTVPRKDKTQECAIVVKDGGVFLRDFSSGTLEEIGKETAGELIVKCAHTLPSGWYYKRMNDYIRQDIGGQVSESTDGIDNWLKETQGFFWASSEEEAAESRRAKR